MAKSRQKDPDLNVKFAKKKGHYYGKRRVIYVQILEPGHRGPQKHLSVYGKSLKSVVKVVDKALEEAFGKTDSGRPTGRPRGRRTP